MTTTCTSPSGWSSFDADAPAHGPGRPASVVLLGALAAAACGGARPSSGPSEAAVVDLILVGGVVHTLDPARPRAEGVAVRDGRIAAVGTSDELRRLAGPGARVIELDGGAVTPGLVDGHCHLYGLGHALSTLDLRGTRAPADVAARVADAAGALPPGEWVVGRGWDQNDWTPAEYPTRAVLDAVAPDRPVALRRIDGHALWANGAALRAAGLDRDTPDPDGGRILRDAAGEPTGVLIDRAVDLVEGRVPRDGADAIERKILAGAEAAIAAGLTGVHEMGIPDDVIAVYRRLAAEGRLPLRVVAYLEGDGGLRSLSGRRPDVDPDGTARFVLRGVKLYADGALGSRGAALLEPYDDEPAGRGLLLTPPEELRRAVELAAAGGWQLAVHAIGDRANRLVLDALEAGAGPRLAGLRFRIEHAQVLAPEDAPRFGRLGVIAAMQPTHATSDMPWAEARLGPERIRGAYAWRAVLDGGAHLLGGSDFPIEEVSPLAGLHAAVTRQDGRGQPAGGWYPAERLTLDEALAAFTVEAAWAAGVEAHRGRIVPGAVADLTVLDRELAAGPELLAARVVLTMVGGRIVHERAR